MDLLFVLSLFHGLTKLRLSTGSTRAILSAATTDLGERLRDFKQESDQHPTKELDTEAVNRQRQQARTETRKHTRAAAAEATNDRSKGAEGQPKEGISVQKSELHGGMGRRGEAGGAGEAKQRKDKGKGKAPGRREAGETGEVKQGKSAGKGKGKGKMAESREAKLGKDRGRAKGKGKGSATSAGDVDNEPKTRAEDPDSDTGGERPKPKGRKVKWFTLRTYKVHKLGHYTETILHYRTLDNHNTQWVSGVVHILLWTRSLT